MAAEAEMQWMAVWLQTGDVSERYVLWLTVFVGLVALAMVVQAIAIAVLASKAVKLLTDMKASFDESKGKAMPILEKVGNIATSTQVILADLTPKIKVISENVVETTHTVRQTAAKLDVTVRQAADKASVTFDEANQRTRKQVIRVDGMIAATLAATAEIGATVNEGIRVPARKIAVLVTQSKHMIDTLVDRAKALGFPVGSTVDAKMQPKDPRVK